MAERCSATTKGGKPCGGTPVPGEDLCPWHSPSWAERRRAWSVKGGQGKSNKRRAAKRLAEPMGPAELQILLGAVLRDVVAGRVEPGVANAAAALGRALVTVTEASDIEKRLTALEEAATAAEPSRTPWRA